MARTKWFLPAVFSLMSLLAFGQAGQNQQRSRGLDEFVIRGKVVIPNSRAADRVEVRLEKSALQVIQTTYTDSIGNFDFRSVPPGAYVISINVDGYEPVRQTVEVFGSLGNPLVTIVLSDLDGKSVPRSHAAPGQPRSSSGSIPALLDSAFCHSSGWQSPPAFRPNRMTHHLACVCGAL
jgi:hypothetical protein